jgi:Flp pilus assembly protein TadG
VEGTRRFALRDERGSIIPFVLGCFLLAMVLVAGAVAAGDAFVQQTDLQSACDSAAVAGANAADLSDSRDSGSTGATQLPLGGVQNAVLAYLARDPERSTLQVQAQIAPDGGSVELACAVHETITFGAIFGLGGGVQHRTTSSARAPLH